MLHLRSKFLSYVPVALQWQLEATHRRLGRALRRASNMAIRDQTVVTTLSHYDSRPPQNPSRFSIAVSPENVTREWPGQLASPSEDDLPSPTTNEAMRRVISSSKLNWPQVPK
jgi:hypothetical protein